MLGCCDILVGEEWGKVALVITDLLLADKEDFEPIGAPRYCKVCLLSMICSVVVFAATSSERPQIL